MTNNTVIVIRNPNKFIVTVNGSHISSCNNPTVLLNNLPLTTEIANLAVGNLTDVISANVVDGDTLVYDQNLGKYVVKQIEFNEIEGPLDGGMF